MQAFISNMEDMFKSANNFTKVGTMIIHAQSV